MIDDNGMAAVMTVAAVRLCCGGMAGGQVDNASGAWASAESPARLSLSASQTLMIDWRVTPRRDASRSSCSTIQIGKSTLTRLCSSLGDGRRTGQAH